MNKKLYFLLFPLSLLSTTLFAQESVPKDTVFIYNATGASIIVNYEKCTETRLAPHPEDPGYGDYKSKTECVAGKAEVIPAAGIVELGLSPLSDYAYPTINVISVAYSESGNPTPSFKVGAAHCSGSKSAVLRLDKLTNGFLCTTDYLGALFS